MLGFENPKSRRPAPKLFAKFPNGLSNPCEVFAVLLLAVDDKGTGFVIPGLVAPKVLLGTVLKALEPVGWNEVKEPAIR